ncbi:MAG: DMT family transporter [Rhizobiaceae bacterium]
MSDAALPETRDRVFAGILLTIVAYAIFSVQDAAIKLLVASYAVWQILFFRSVVILVGCFLIGGRRLVADTARSHTVKPMMLRSLLILAAWLCYYTAARDLQLAELTTIYFAAPLIVTALSIVILGEQVPAYRWLAVIIGFVGVFIACDPANLGFSQPVLLVLLAALFWAIAIVLMRKIALQERTIIQLVLNNAFLLVISLVPLAFVWVSPSWQDLAMLVGLGILAGLAQFTLFEGMKRAPASVAATFEYTSLVWAFLLGYLIWSDIPRDEVFMGAILIALAGLLMVGGERLRSRRAG